ncbi:MAG: hypothetical protein ACM3WP_10130 [Acidobacteriota bacterium]
MKHLLHVLLSFLVTTVALAQRDNPHLAPIALHPENPHYFLLHDRALALIGSGEHYGAVLNGDFDYAKYLATLEAEGMNYTRLFGGSYVEVPGKSFGILRNDLAPASGRFVAPWARSETAGYAGGGNKFDLEKWNPEYFARLHGFLAEAERREIVVEITLFSSQYAEAQWAMSPFNRANNVNQTDAIDWKKVNTLENGNVLAHQEKYVRKLVREANRSPNVIFEIANEPWSDRPVLANVVNPYLFAGRDQYPNSVDLPDDLSMTWQTRVAEWITSEESKLPNRHLIAQNCCNFVYPMRQTIPGVSVVNFHYAYPEAAVLNYGLGKALSYDETGFLGREDGKYTRQAWNFMLSGGGVFDNLDYSFSVGDEDGKDREANGPGGGSPELRRRLRILSDFLRDLPLVEMAPDFDTVQQAGGVVTHMLSSHTGEYAMYVDGDGPAEIRLKLPPGKYSGSWVDAITGERKDVGGFNHPGGEKILKTPAFRNGIAARISRK